MFYSKLCFILGLSLASTICFANTNTVLPYDVQITFTGNKVGLAGEPSGHVSCAPAFGQSNQDVVCHLQYNDTTADPMIQINYKSHHDIAFIAIGRVPPDNHAVLYLAGAVKCNPTTTSPMVCKIG